MPYSPPSGWVETRPQVDDDTPLHVRFHARRDCPRVGDPAGLRQVDKPYSATRCTFCASELSDSTRAEIPEQARSGSATGAGRGTGVGDDVGSQIA